MGIPLIWVGGLREIQGTRNYVRKTDTNDYKEIWKVLVLLPNAGWKDSKKGAEVRTI